MARLGSSGDAKAVYEAVAIRDIQDAAVGTNDKSFLLRAERSGTGTGRIYSVTYRATDASKNTTDAVATVVVPH